MDFEYELPIEGVLKLNLFKNPIIRLYHQPKKIDCAEMLTTEKSRTCDFYIDLEIIELTKIK